MRIIAGTLKGYTLHETKSKNTRPLRDMARENVFNLLTHSNKIKFKIKKSNILDLYAGTGSFGLECLSREAANVFFVEKSKDTSAILEKNIEKLKLKSNTKIFISDVFSIIDKQKNFQSKFDLIFCDPPFKDKNMKNLIELIDNKKLIKENGIIILHRESKTEEKLPECFTILEERIYGVSKITFGKL